MKTRFGSPHQPRLRREGSPLTAADGNSVVRVFQERPRDIGVILLDLNLPGISGYEALRRIRQIQPEAKVLLTSAYDPQHAAFASDMDSAKFLQKPYEFADLLRGLHVSQRSRLEQLGFRAGKAHTIEGVHPTSISGRAIQCLESRAISAA